MNKVTLDRSTLAKLDSFRERAEVCDESGRTVGFFLPAKSPSRPEIDVPFSEEELDRFELESGGRSLAEILAGLEEQS